MMRIILMMTALSLFSPAANAPTITDHPATVRFRQGILFTLHAQNIVSAELRLTYPQRADPDVRAVALTHMDDVATAEYVLKPEEAGIAAGSPIGYEWRARDQSGGMATAAGSVTYEDTHFGWRQFQNGPVTVRLYAGDPAFISIVQRTTTDALTTMQANYGLSPTAPIFVNIYAARTDFLSNSPDAPEWAGGDTVPQRGEINTYLSGDGAALWRVGEVLPHELSHMLVYQWAGRAALLWLDEGLAVTNQAATSINYATYLDRALKANTLLPMSALERSFPTGADDALLAYAESRSIVGFLLERYGTARVGLLIKALRDDTTDGALRRLFGLDSTQLQTQWLNGLYGRTVALPPTPASIAPASNKIAAPQNTLFVALLLGSVAAIIVAVSGGLWLRRRKT